MRSSDPSRPFQQDPCPRRPRGKGVRRAVQVSANGSGICRDSPGHKPTVAHVTFRLARQGLVRQLTLTCTSHASTDRVAGSIDDTHIFLSSRRRRRLMEEFKYWGLDLSKFVAVILVRQSK